MFLKLYAKFCSLESKYNISIVDVFKIMTKLETDTVHHMNEDIKTVLDVVTSIAKYIYVASKEVLKEAQLIQEAEELVNYIERDEDY